MTSKLKKGWLKMTAFKFDCNRYTMEAEVLVHHNLSEACRRDRRCLQIAGIGSCAVCVTDRL